MHLVVFLHKDRPLLVFIIFFNCGIIKLLRCGQGQHFLKFYLLVWVETEFDKLAKTKKQNYVCNNITGLLK